MFNLETRDSLDPDWKYAECHGLANKAGIFQQKIHSSGQPEFMCPCCHEQVHKAPAPLCQNSKQLQFLGFGYPLFYEFLKSCIFLLILSILSYHAVQLQIAVQQNYDFCNTSHKEARRLLSGATEQPSVSTVPDCTSFLIQMSQISTTVSLTQQALRLSSFFLQLLALIYIRNRITKLQDYYDQRTPMISDYSISVKGLTKMKGIQKKIRSFFQDKQIFGTQYKIKQLTLLPQYPEMDKLKEQKKHLIDMLRPFYDQNTQSTNQKALQLNEDLKKIQQKILQFAISTKELAAKDQLECQKLICVFNKESQKQQIITKFKSIPPQPKTKYFGEFSHKIYLKQAPEPQQIIWKNANISQGKKILLVLLGWSLSILLLVITFIIFYKILEAKTLHLDESIQLLHEHPHQQYYISLQHGAIFLVFFLMFFIVLFDKILLATLFYKFTELQRHSTTSKFQFSFALKLALGLFFTTAIMTLAVEAYRFNNYYTHAYGVIEEQSIMFFMNAFFVPFFWIVNPMRIFKQIKRYFKKGKRSLTQIEANQLMEDEKYDMGKRFAQVLEMMWFTYLYSTLIPIGAVIICVGLCIYYWIDKYNLLRRSSVNGTISGTLIDYSLTLLDCTLLCRAVGTIVFDAQIRNLCLPSTIAMLLISVVYLFLPLNTLIGILNEQKFRPEEKLSINQNKAFQKIITLCILFIELFMSKNKYKGYQIEGFHFSQLVSINKVRSLNWWKVKLPRVEDVFISNYIFIININKRTLLNHQFSLIFQLQSRLCRFNYFLDFLIQPSVKIIYIISQYFIRAFFLQMQLDYLDPDWTFATNHGLANKAGISQLGKDVVVCRCCHEPIQKQPVSLWENSKQLQFLGFGFPLFYEFLKNCILLLVLAILSYNAIQIQQSISSNAEFCHPTQNHSARLLGGTTPTDPAASQTTTTTIHCTSFLVQMSRIQHDASLEQQSIRIISFVLQLLALLYIRNRVSKLQKYYDERTTSLSDFSVFFKGFTKMNGIQAKLKQFLLKEYQTQHKVMQITLFPEYDQIQNLMKQKQKLIDDLRPFYDSSTETTDEIALGLNKKIKQVQEAIQQAALATKQHASKDELQCEKIICVFNTEIQKEEVIDGFKDITDEKKQQYFGPNYKHIYAIEAPQPSQIIWKNANISKSKKFFLVLTGWGLSFLLLVVLFAVFFKILQAKSLVLEDAILKMHEHPQDSDYINQYNGAIALVYILIFFVILFDKLVLSTLFYKFTEIERHSNTSKFQFSFALKLSLGLFFTTALMTLAVEAYRFKNYYIHPYGVIEEETIMFFMNSFFVPFFWIVNPTRIFKQIKRYLKKGKRSITQKQANQIMEEEKYELGKRFAQILQIMWFTFLYSTLIPIGAVITCVGLGIYYWVDKYNLLRRSSVSGNISGRLIQTSLSLLDLTLLLRPLGTLLFDAQLRDVYLPSTIVLLCVSVVYVLLPKDKLIQLFNSEKFRPEEKTYLQVKQQFDKTYHSLHPVYRAIHSNKIVKKLLSKGISFDLNRTDNTLNDSEILIAETSMNKFKLPPLKLSSSIIPSSPTKAEIPFQQQ